jgi:hypothetical protein
MGPASMRKKRKIAAQMRYIYSAITDGNMRRTGTMFR